MTKKPKPAPPKPQAAPAPQEVPSVIDLLGQTGKDEQTATASE